MGAGGIEPPTLRASVACSPTELPSLISSKDILLLNVLRGELEDSYCSSFDFYCSFFDSYCSSFDFYCSFFDS